HQIVKSGRGWHIYLKLDKSYSITEIVEVNRQLVELFDADLNACTSTQIARIPYTKNFKTNTYASLITTENTVIKPYKLSDLKSHKATEFITNNTELQIDNIEDLYCFAQLVKHGISKGSRNQALIFISSTCKYADLSENKALQYALEFNSNCKEQQTKAEVKKVVKSVYDNISLVKPCKNKFASKFCSSSCKAKVISVADVLNKVELTIDNQVLGLTSKHIITKVKDSKTGVKKDMLEVLTGSDLILIATLKILSHHVHTIESLIEFTKISRATVVKSLKHLEELNIINTSKQSLNNVKKPTNVYFYNFEYEKYNAEILH
ncbi:MAG: primase C-terminal domain-containing protein, partial [Peptostreptococcaceae bacterium]